MTSSLIWTTDKPTTPGWYWYRERDFFLEAVVVHVRDQENRLAAHYEDDGAPNFFGFIDQLKGEWVGPFELPR